MKGKEIVRTSEEMVAYYEDLNKFPIISLEDGLKRRRPGWMELLAERLGKRIQLVGTTYL